MDRRTFVTQVQGAVAVTLLSGGTACRWTEESESTGADLRFLAIDGEFVHSRPCFAPGGGRVLFMRAPAGPDPARTREANASEWSLWSVPEGGGEPTLVFTDPVLRATRPDPSPVDDVIAFTGIRGDAAELWLVNGDGSGARPVPIGAPPMDRLFYPSWFADGRHVAVTDYRRRQALKVDVESGAVTPLTDPAEVWAGMAAVSPTGRLAFAGQVPDAHYEVSDNRIWLQDAGGDPVPLDGEHGRTPSWSPDGSRLAFSSTRRRGTSVSAVVRSVLRLRPSSIFVAEWTDGVPAVRPVSPAEVDAIHPKWSTDGRRVVCMAGDPASGRSGIAVLGV